MRTGATVRVLARDGAEVTVLDIPPMAEDLNKVAEEIVLREIHSELYSTSGDFDLMLKLYIPESEDVGKYINDHLLDIAGLEPSSTTLTFKAF